MLKGNSVQGIYKIRALPSGTISETSEVENFATAYIDRRNMLSTQLEKGGRSERDKLDLPSSDARPIVAYITLTIKLCLQRDSVARVY